MADERAIAAVLAEEWVTGALWGHTQHRSRCTCPDDPGEGEEDSRCVRHRRYQVESMTASVLAALDPILNVPAIPTGDTARALTDAGHARVAADELFDALDAAHDTARHVHASECCWPFPGVSGVLLKAATARAEGAVEALDEAAAFITTHGTFHHADAEHRIGWNQACAANADYLNGKAAEVRAAARTGGDDG